MKTSLLSTIYNKTHIINCLFVSLEDGDGVGVLPDVPEGNLAVPGAAAHDVGLAGVLAQAGHPALVAVGAHEGGGGGVGRGAEVVQLQLAAHVAREHLQEVLHVGLIPYLELRFLSFFAIDY